MTKQSWSFRFSLLFFLIFYTDVTLKASTTLRQTTETIPLTTDEDEGIETNPKTADDRWLFDSFHGSIRLRIDNIDRRFPNEYNNWKPTEKLEFASKLGLLALYYRMHIKHVRHAIRGYRFGYPDGVGYRFDKSVTSHCTIFGWGIQSCIKSFYNEITEDSSNAWLTALHNTSLSDEFMAENLDSRKMERDLSIGQVLCHFTMRFEFFRQPIPFCFYDTLSDAEIRKGKLPPNWNGELLRLKFDFYNESYEGCALKSFCPNPCEELTEKGELVMGCPSTGKKCEIRTEFNDNIIGLRHNDWNETCSCHEHHIYQKEVGKCVFQNFCRYKECPEFDSRCVCQLGFYRNETKNCMSIGQPDLAWASLAVSRASHLNSFWLLIIFCVLVFVF